MSRKIINIGSANFAGDGEPIRDALIKVNQNFEEVYNDIDIIKETEIDLTGLATEDYVNQAINNIQVPDLLLDISQLTDDNKLLNVKDYIEITSRIDFVADSEVVFEKILGVSEIDYIDNNIEFARSIASIELGIAAGGIYNAALEESHNQLISPAGTLWNADGWSNLDNVQSRTYTPLRETLKGQGNFRNNILSTDLVMKDTINNKYYTFRFSQWSQGAQHDGIFAYTRRLLDTSGKLGLTFPDGSVQYTAKNELVFYPQTYVGNTSGFEFRPQDAGHHILVTGVDLTLPNSRELPVPIGTTIKIVTGAVTELNPNLTTIVPKSYGDEDSAVIVKQFGNGEPCTLPEKSICTLIKTATNQWQISGIPAALSFFDNDANFITATDIPTDLKGSVFADDSTLMIDGVNGKIVGPLEGNSFSGTIDFSGATVTGLNFVPVEYRTAYTDDSVIYTVDLFQFKMTSGDLQIKLVAPAGIVVSASISSIENINGTISGNITGTLTLSDSTWSTINGTTTSGLGDTIVATVVSPQDGRMYRVTVFRGEIAGLHRVIIETLAK